MQRMCRRIFAAVVGLFAVAGTAAAQSPPPSSLPPIAGVSVPAYQAATPITPASGATVIRGQGGCAGCASTVPGGTVSSYPQYGLYGPKDRNGCGSYRSDLGFIFGSCKSFFDPCGPQPCGGCGGGGRGGKGCGGGLFNRNCPPHQFGQPYGTPFNGCVYDSYLNH
jgi:hypothetical protein